MVGQEERSQMYARRIVMGKSLEDLNVSVPKGRVFAVVLWGSHERQFIIMGVPPGLSFNPPLYR